MIKVQSSEDYLQTVELGAFVPAATNEIPLRVKFTAHQTPIASVLCCQDHSRIVVSWGCRQVLERGAVQIDGSGTREGLESLEFIRLMVCGEHAENK